ERKTSATRGEQAESGDDSGDPMPPQAVIPDDRPRPPVLGTRPEVDAPPVAHRRHEDIEPELEVRLPADLPHAAVTRRYGSENRVFRQIARTRGVPVRAIACERKCAHTIRAVETASAEAQPRPRLRPDIRESNGGSDAAPRSLQPCIASVRLREGLDAARYHQNGRRRGHRRRFTRLHG